MGRPFKLNPDLADQMCGFARQGMPIGRAAALAGCHRVTVQAWMREGAIEIGEAGDDDAELGPRAEFALSFGAARAEYLLKLNTQWQAAIARKDHNVANVIAAMLASQAPDEYSERRATRTVDQRTTLAGEIGVTRFASMSTEDLEGEHQRIQARRTAAKAQHGDDWREAMVDRPGQAGGGGIDDPAPAPEEKNPGLGNPRSGSQTRKSDLGALPAHDHGSTENILPSRARGSDALVEADRAVVMDAGSAPGADEGAVHPGDAPSSSYTRKLVTR